jgi:hypothetical protein
MDAFGALIFQVIGQHYPFQPPGGPSAASRTCSAASFPPLRGHNCGQLG